MASSDDELTIVTEDELQITYGSLLATEPARYDAEIVSISENEFSSASKGPHQANPITPIFACSRRQETNHHSYHQISQMPPLKYYPRRARDDLQGDNQQFYDTRKRFLDDLNNYLPLGCILAVAQDGFFLNDAWEEQPPDEIVGLDSSNTKGFCQLWFLHLEGLVRLFVKRLPGHDKHCIVRVFLLSDDVGRRWIKRDGGPARTFRSSLKTLMADIIDFSADTWNGQLTSFEQRRFLNHCFRDPDRDDLLFYIFNTISSPTPDEVLIDCPFSRDAFSALLDASEILPGMQTILYPYQRRSAATMIRREVQPARNLDPRLEVIEGPDGNRIYYDEQTNTLLRDRRTYEEPRGGILAETMGLGKTLICLAVILATRGHWPRIPAEYSTNLYTARPKVGRLVDMAAAAIARQQIPWRVYFQEVAANETCVSILEKNVGSYTIVPRQTKHTRRPSITLKEQVIRLCPVTLAVVPLNLFHHWQNEMATHVSKDVLRVVFVRTLESPMPSEDEIIVSDVVLMTKQRFEREMKPLDPTYQSPLKNLHFLRIIVDEGHDFGSSSAGTNAIFALQKLHVDRRWIISGTPTSGLLGVEVDLAAKETSDGAQITPTASLVKRRTGDMQERTQERRDLERLGRIAKDFFQLRPWANSKGDDAASWQDYVMPHRNGARKLRSLRSILESLVVRHRLEDVERDIQLPPLYNRVVTISPTWHDKISLNLFLLNLCVNAITSERVDQDYMFHPKNRGKLGTLIGNLRQAGFYWTGHDPVEISKALEVSEKYLKSRMSSDRPLAKADEELLIEASSTGRAALLSDTWKNLSQLNELGVYVDAFPAEAQEAWSPIETNDRCEPMLIAVSHLGEAQKAIDSHLHASSPLEDFAGVGKTVLQKAWDNAANNSDTKASPTSSFDELKILSKYTISRAKAGPSPRKKRKVLNGPMTDAGSPAPALPLPIPKSVLRPESNQTPVSTVPTHSDVAKSKIVGFGSAKLTYLLDRIIALHQSEKIIIFYEGNNIAYYIAQALELIDIRYLIYTGTLVERRKAAYITTFNATENFRVMLMDLSQAAHGLHVASASRVFFVNPVWQPKIEAQAIKRAHRIGQTKPVYVETLVLSGTLEDQMRSRRKSMSTEEHQRAEKSLLDDDIMKRIIQDAKFIPMATEQSNDAYPFARLEVSQQLFGRVSGNDISVDPDADLIFPGEEPRKGKQETSEEPVSLKRPASVSPTPGPSRKKVVSFEVEESSG